MQVRCARILLFSHRFGCLEHPAAFHDPKPALVARAFFLYGRFIPRQRCG